MCQWYRHLTVWPNGSRGFQPGSLTVMEAFQWLKFLCAFVTLTSFPKLALPRRIAYTEGADLRACIMPIPNTSNSDMLHFERPSSETGCPTPNLGTADKILDHLLATLRTCTDDLCISAVHNTQASELYSKADLTTNRRMSRQRHRCFESAHIHRVFRIREDISSDIPSPDEM